MESVCGFRPGRGYGCRARLDSRPSASEHAHTIHRSVWSAPLCFPSPAAGHKYISELLCLYFFGEVARAGVWLELSFYHGHVVAGRVHYMLMVWALAPRRQIEVAAYASGNSWLGA